MVMIHLDDGFLFGQAVFTTMKVIQGQPIWLDRHLKRLSQSADYLGFKSSADEVWVRDYILEQKITNAAVKLVVSDRNRLISHRQDPYGLELLDPISIGLANTHRHSSNQLLQHKTTMYWQNKMALGQTRQSGNFEVCFLNEKDHICEGSFTNLFFIKDDKLYTPNLEAGLLAGLMREWVMDQYPVVEGPISWSQVPDFQAVFISNCLMGVRPASRLGNYQYSQHEMVKQIHQRWMEEIKPKNKPDLGIL